MADCQPVQIDLAPTFGLQYWGLLVSILLLGAAIVQAYLYYMDNSDGWFMRTFVAIMLAFDIAVTMLVSEAMHYYLISSFGNPARLAQMTQSFVAEIVVAIVVVLMSQHFYASRVLAAGRKNLYARIASVLISVGSLASFGAAVAVCVKLYTSGRSFMSSEQPSYKLLIGAWSFVNVFCDAVATFSMCYFLSSYKSSFRSTTSVVNSLLLFAINRGFLVFAVQVGFVVAFIVAPSKGYWAPFHLVLPKLHVNTLLAMLNSRTALRNKIDGRVNVVEGGRSSNTIHPLTDINLESAASIRRNAKSDNRIAADVPQHNRIHVAGTLVTFIDGDRGVKATGNSIKEQSIVS